MNNLEIIKNEFKQLKGQFIITDSWTVERLVAISDDGMDYYYVTYNGRNFSFYSCVGSIIALKGKINDKDYENLIHIGKLNHSDQSTLWANDITEERLVEIQKHKTGLMTLKGTDKFLTEVCWDLT